MTDSKIYKYELAIIPSIQEVTMPKGANILSIQNQDGVVTMWAIFNEMVQVYKDSTEVRQFQLFGTGCAISGIDKKTYIGTVQIRSYVWHVFEIVEAYQSMNTAEGPIIKKLD